MNRGNMQNRPSESEQGRRVSRYEPRNRQDSRGYGARSLENDKDREHDHYIDQESLRRRRPSGDGERVWNSRIESGRTTGEPFAQGRRGDWSQFESQDLNSQAPGRGRSVADFSWNSEQYRPERSSKNELQASTRAGTTKLSSRSDSFAARPFEYQDHEPTGRSGPHTGRGPKGYRRSDERIVEEACLRLERAGDVDASEIEVTSAEGVITLRGKVEDRVAKRRAEECIEDIYGVRDVMNELQVAKGLFTNLFNSSDGNVARDELLGKL